VFDPSLRVMALSPNGRHSVLANSLEQAVFEVATGKKIIALNDSGGVCFSTNGLTLVAYNGNEVSLWDISSGKQFRRFAFNSSYLTPGYVNTDCLSMSPDKKLLAVGWFTKMNTVGIISLESGKLLDTFECGPPLMMCSTVNFSPTGRMFATDTDSVDNNDREAEPLLRFWKIPDSW
jgi:WD40 repeat protein